MWQTSGSWDRIDRDNGVDAMLKYADAGVTTFFVNIVGWYFIWFGFINFVVGPAEELYGIFINRVRQERPPEYLEKMVDAWRGWSLFQALLQTLKGIATKHGVSIANVAVKYVLDQEDRSSIKEVTKKGKNLQVIGDCGDEYRRR
ncbi:hypothetical protein ACFX12_029941 [Malus domestica]